MNFARVSETLYRGGQPTAEGFAELKKMGVKTVVCLRTFDSDRSLLKGLGLRSVHISFKPGHPEDEDVVAFLEAAGDPANHPVFVHCRRGTDRTGMMIAAYRMVVEGWSEKRAVDEMQQMGFNNAWDSIRDYLEKLDVVALKHSLMEGA